MKAAHEVAAVPYELEGRRVLDLNLFSLASSRAASITGTEYIIDGGTVLTI